MITLVRSKNHVWTVPLIVSFLILGGCKKEDSVAPGVRTRSFGVIQTTPSNGEVNVSPETHLYLNFSDLIDTGSVRLAFSLVPTVAGTFLLYSGATYFYFRPTQALRTGMTYNVSVGPSMRAANGDTLGTEHLFWFRVMPFAVIQTHPDSGETGVSRTVTFQIRFNDGLDSASVPHGFTISPYVPGLITVYQGSSSFYFYLSNPLNAYATYTVRIGTAIRSSVGDSLATPYVFPFTSGQ